MNTVKIISRSVSLILTAVFILGALASCGQQPFENDVRYRYDYDLSQYLKKGKYSGLEVYVGNTDVTQDEITKAIARELVGMDVEDVYDRPCQKGDLVGIAYQGYRRGDSGEFDVPIDELSKGFRLGEIVGTPEEIEELGSSYYHAVVLGCDELFPGFDSQIIGNFSVGDRKLLTYTMPDPCWAYPELSGEEIQVDVELIYIQGNTQLDGDEYAAEIGYGTYDDYKLYRASKMIESRENEVKEYVRVKVWKQINDNFTVKQYPEKELSEMKESLRAAYVSTAQRRVKEILRVEVVHEFFTLAAEKNETIDEYIVNDLGLEKDGERDDEAFSKLITVNVNQKLEAMSEDEIFAKFLSDYLGVTSEQFEERVENEAKETVKDEMIVYYIARSEKKGVSDLDMEDYIETNYVDTGDYSSIEQYIVYVAVQSGFVDNESNMTEEIYEKAKGEIKQVILFNAIDELIDEKTNRKK